jgi:LmbE family N-acetylglucosaminyl deacetylase
MSERDISKLGTVLGIWAHPDDEAYSSAGLMRIASKNGQRLGIVTATKGDAGQSADEKRWPQKQLAHIREQEQQGCLRNIGDVELTWLNYKDGTLINQSQDEAVFRLVNIINEFKPDTILSFAADGITGHDDHKTIHKWVKAACQLSDSKLRFFGSVMAAEDAEHKSRILSYDEQFNLFFNTDEPLFIGPNKASLYVVLDEEELDCKIACLKAHASQTTQVFEADGGESIMKDLCQVEAFVEFEL